MNKKATMKNCINNQKGIASIETVVLLVLFVSLVYYTFGFFGVVHSAVIHNIHARTYAFETFRHRTNLMYFRTNRRVKDGIHYYERGSRLHGINSESGDNQQMATERPITMGFPSDEDNRREAAHNDDIVGRVVAGERNTNVGVNPVWIMVMYGICFNADCGRP